MPAWRSAVSIGENHLTNSINSLHQRTCARYGRVRCLLRQIVWHLFASSGVSAFVRTPKDRTSSAHSMSVPNCPLNSGWISATCPSRTSPVDPLSVMIVSLSVTFAFCVKFRCLFIDKQRDEHPSDTTFSHAACDDCSVACHTPACGEYALPRHPYPRYPPVRSRHGRG